MKACPNQQKLVLLADGELSVDESRGLHAHLEVCPECKRFFALLSVADEALVDWGQTEVVPPEALATTGEALANHLREKPLGLPEVMTLPEVVDFLRLSPEEANEVLPELPMFELAGQLRVRRQSLLAWIEERERRYKHEQLEGWTRRVANGVA